MGPGQITCRNTPPGASSACDCHPGSRSAVLPCPSCPGSGLPVFVRYLMFQLQVGEAQWLFLPSWWEVGFQKKRPLESQIPDWSSRFPERGPALTYSFMFIYVFVYLVTIWYLGLQFWSQPCVSVQGCTAVSHRGSLTPRSRPPLETSLSGPLCSGPPRQKRWGQRGEWPRSRTPLPCPALLLMPVLPLSAPLGTGAPLFSALYLLARGPHWHVSLGARREVVNLSHWKGALATLIHGASQLPQGH